MSFQEALSSALEAWLKQSQTSTKLSLPKAKLGIDWQKPLSREDIYEHINGDLSR